MNDYFPIYIYFGVVVVMTMMTLSLSSLFKPKINVPNRYLPYESGIRTTTDLLHERFPLRHYLVALMFLIFDVEVIFLYPWAVIAKEIGAFAFWEMCFFILIILVGFGYIWKKGGLQWE